MSSAKLTMLSFNKYLNDMYEGQTLFDLLTLPEGISKDDLVDNILLQGGEFEVLYSNPVFMREAIGSWGRKCYNTFLRWITAQSIEYNPLENYDRMEDWDDTLNKGISSSAAREMSNERTFDNADTTTHDTTSTDTEEVSAFDSSSYQPSGKNTIENDGTDKVEYSGTIKDELGESSTGHESENRKDVHSGRIHGNIGVTTSQQMLQSEYDIARFNIIDQITDMFILEFCIPVYD